MPISDEIIAARASMDQDWATAVDWFESQCEDCQTSLGLLLGMPGHCGFLRMTGEQLDQVAALASIALRDLFVRSAEREEEEDGTDG